MSGRFPGAGRVPPGRLLAALLAVALGIAGTLLTEGTAPGRDYAIQLDAAQRAQAAQRALLDVMRRERIAMQPEDVNHTGLIGPQWSPLTASVGVLEAKRTALNPNFAALMVACYRRAGLGAGDTVAIGLSGSFPALGIAAIAAANAMDIRARVIASYGASMYGASRPDMSVVRMLRLLEERGLLRFDMVAVSPGAEDDRGGNPYWEGAREAVLTLAREDGYPLIDEGDLARNIALRMSLYGDGVGAFVNVGGALANMGADGHALRVPPGLTRKLPDIPADDTRGVMLEYLARGVPVIHLLNIRALAADSGLPYDPVPLPQPGEGDVYVRRALSPWPAAAALLAAGLALAGFRKGTKRRMRKAGHA